MPIDNLQDPSQFDSYSREVAVITEKVFITQLTEIRSREDGSVVIIVESEHHCKPQGIVSTKVRLE